MSFLRLYEMAAADVPTPPSGRYSFFFDSSNGEPSFKDDAGVVTSLAGIPGVGVPAGGTAGQVLAKVSGADYDTEWASAGAGDVTGPASSTDNTLPRFNGTTGKTIQGSSVAVSDNDEISGYRANINAQTGTTYTLQASDAGKVVELTNAAAITLTLPNSLPAGFCCSIAQGGAGQVTFSAASGATLRNRQAHTKLAGQWSMASLVVRGNSGGSAAEYVLAGDTAA